MSELDYYCYFSYLGPLWLAGLLSERRNNRRLRFHMNQGIVLTVLEVIMAVTAVYLDAPLHSIPHVGVYLAVLLDVAFIAAAFVLSAMGMLNVSRGEQKRLPVIGKIELLR